ncbi:MAG: membrane protein insertase YidC [Candidatus Omnitrophica bacterium]|nr:membrane protein insertase YidC [Candidatus Omnitrophota bacterium]
MKSEKNFFIVIIITVGVLVFYPMLIKNMFPRFFPEQPQPALQVEQTSAYKEIEPKQQASIGVTYLKEKTYSLHNNLYEIEVNSPNADIKSIKLLQIADPLTNEPTVLMDTQDMMPGIFSDSGLTDKAVIQNIESSNNAVLFYYKHEAGLNIRKQLRIDDDMYSVSLSYEIENPSKIEKALSYRLIAAAGIKNTAKVDARFNNQITVLKNKKTIKKNLGNISHKTIEGEIELTGAILRYFSLITVPLVTSDYVYSYSPVSNGEFLPTSVGLGTNNLVVPAQETVRLNYVLYAGPNDREQMSKLNLAIEQARGKGLFAGLSDLMLLLLRVLHKLCRNYGVAVIGLSLTINILLYPLTFKSLKSMKDMQAIQPLIEKLRSDHKDNPQKLNKEIMELYKKHKVNPAGGCLPMLLQMPIFFSLYGVLMQAIELRGAGFLWIKNLAAPDAFISFPAAIPIIGSSLNILPLVMMGFSFLQQKATNTGHANEQQKVMAMMMPVLLGVIFYNFPAGLVLYFLTNSIFSFFIQKNLTKQTVV